MHNIWVRDVTDVISVFSRGGQSFDRLARGGSKYERKKNCAQKHKKLLFFKFRRGANASPAPQNDVPNLGAHGKIGCTWENIVINLLNKKNS